MKTNPARSADAKEICELLEQAVLRYFPRPVENVDTFLFANGDDSKVGDLRSEHPSGVPATTVLDKVKRGLTFKRFTHPF